MERNDDDRFIIKLGDGSYYKGNLFDYILLGNSGGGHPKAKDYTFGLLFWFMLVPAGLLVLFALIFCG